MKIKKFIISATLIFALTNYAYGMGGHHHRYRGSYSGGSATTNTNGGNEAKFEVFNGGVSNSEGNGAELQDNDSASGSEGNGATFLALNDAVNDSWRNGATLLGFNDIGKSSSVSTPEPTTMLLLGFGLLGLWGARRKFKK